MFNFHSLRIEADGNGAKHVVYSYLNILRPTASVHFSDITFLTPVKF